MHLTLSMNDLPNYRVQGLLSGTIGSSIVAIAHLLALPANAAEARRAAPRGLIVSGLI